MIKPINQFGGWLRFFQIISWLNFIVAVVLFFIYSASLAQVFDDRDIVLDTAGGICMIISGVCFYIIATCLPIQNPDMPKKISQTSSIVLFMAISFPLLEAGIEAYRTGDGFFDHYHGGGSFWILALQIYLWRSKRVLSYYGNNYNIYKPNR